ncbi:cystathionine gamma-synthase family protein [Fluviicola sp.]|jgi:methionine-gamma-lyase|uniref:cystathionine gamma-synthase family protein n=1 Tax=Fluviicola sp. TaxID=1917219 RepID=UPI002820C7D8|nr:cystathionine gamma-synthase family protein [Fluviicola sp.]MDR0801442.1 cystathionine gamma-synthase family protein [Fluviicola sp.]
MKPESLMMSYGYKPSLSEGAIKCPIFQTSTFVFNTAEEGKAFFEVAYGIREQGENEELGLIYSRLNNPDLEILENRLCLWDKAEDCAVFESGMSAISTALMEFLSPGDVLLYSRPVYGGTDHFINHFLKKLNIDSIGFRADEDFDTIVARIEATGKANRLRMIHIETPANPTNALIDIQMCADIKNRFSTSETEVILSVDNTYMGPLWQHPLKHGADLVLYSATKYIGGHSDVIAGACLGSKALMARIKGLRTFLGNMAGPWTGWLLMRSLETLKVRMEEQAKNAVEVAEFLRSHPKVSHVYYLGFIPEQGNENEKRIYAEQYTSSGAMIAFDVAGGEKGAFTFLNNLKLIKLAVSLGSTESLAEHPATMTHADVPLDVKEAMKISSSLVRLSVGVEHYEDIISDISQALNNV